MKKTIIFSIIAIAFVAVILYFVKSNKKTVELFETEKTFKATIVDKTVATGKVQPLEEVEIKPQISGIIDRIYLEEGAIVAKGDLIATVRIIPNEQALAGARGRLRNLQLEVDNAKILFDRNRELYNKGVVAKQVFESNELAYNQAKQNLKNAQDDYEIIRKGSTGSSGKTANTNIRATTAGMLLEIPVKEGYQVIQSNNFNAGTTIASIADMSKMIFEGQVDEADVGMLEKDSEILVTLGAIEEKKFPALLTFIAPKGTEVQGAVQFKIKADVSLDENYFVRAGYSANAEIVLERRDSVMSVREAILQFDKETEAPYVEVKIGDNEFEKRDIEIGLSDGVNVEVLSGITDEDELKIWNKADKNTLSNNNNN